MFSRILLLICGVFACSTAVIFIKFSHEHPVLLSAYRLFVAVIVLAPLYALDCRKHRGAYTPGHLKASVVPGILLGIHFITWILGARMTTAVNASLIVNLMPIAMPFFLYFGVGEKLNGRELSGTLLALGGLILLGVCDFNASMEYFWGDVWCFVSMLFFTAYMAMGRRNKHFPSVWLYVVPLYLVAGAFCFVAGVFSTPIVKPYSWSEVLLILALGVVPTILGHSLLNQAMRHLRGQVVSIINMGQFIFAGFMALLCFNEVPLWSFYASSVLLVVGGWLAITGGASHGSAAKVCDPIPE